MGAVTAPGTSGAGGTDRACSGGHPAADPLAPGPATASASESESEGAPATLIADPLATISPGDFNPADHSDLGPVVPGYRILGILGHGGMGVVYKAVHLRLGRLVALKMIRGGGLDRPEQLARFRIEAEAVARLNHSHVVQIYDIGEVAGLPYLSLELLEGGRLSDKLAGSPQPARQAAALLIGLAGAIHEAHRAGIVHRDLKPLNVLFDLHGTPKITDFGLAKRLERGDEQTEPGQVMGTPSYMAPEQASGKAREVGPATDIYALGAILYEMLTGRPPFKGTTPMETLLMVLHQEPVPPSRLQPKAPRDLEVICLKCLEREPQKRYATAEALAEDLGRFVAGEAILARPTPVWERGAKWVRRHPTAATLLGLGLATALVLVGAAIQGRERRLDLARREDLRIIELQRRFADEFDECRRLLDRGDPNGAELQLARMEDQARTSPRLGDWQRRIGKALDEAHRRRKDRERYQRFLRRRDEALADHMQLVVRDSAAGLLKARGSALAALVPFGADSDAPSLPTTLEPRARDEVAAGCYELLMVLAELTARPLPGEAPDRQGAEALRHLDRAAELRRASGGPLTMAYHLRRAVGLALAGNAEAARRAHAEAERLGPVDELDQVWIGQECYRRGDWAGALRHFETALQRKPDLFPAQLLSAICDMNTVPSQPAEAKAALTACLQHRDFPWLYLLRGSAYGRMGQIALRDAGSPGVAPGQAKASAADAQDRFEAAEEDFRRAERGLVDDDLRYALHMDRGILRYQRGRLPEAVADFERAIALRPGEFQGYLNLAQALQKRGWRVEAIEQLDQAIARKPRMPALYRERARARLARPGRSIAPRPDPVADNLVRGLAHLSMARARVRPSPTEPDRVRGPLHRKGAARAGVRRMGPPVPVAVEAALHDLEESARLEPPGSREVAVDHVERGELLWLVGRPREALAAGDAAVAIAPDLADGQLVRMKALLDLGRYDAVIQLGERALSRGRLTAEMHAVRGLARVGRNDFPRAIEDYTASLALRPGAARVQADRGWAYLFANAPGLALRDFEQVVKLDPAGAEGYSGRGAALVRLRQPREAVADAEQALRRSEPTSRVLYNAARIYAQAATLTGDGPGAVTVTGTAGPSSVHDAFRYQARALTLIGRALETLPVDRRAEFWKTYIEQDEALRSLRRLPRFERLATRLATVP